MEYQWYIWPTKNNSLQLTFLLGNKLWSVTWHGPQDPAERGVHILEQPCEEQIPASHGHLSSNYPVATFQMKPLKSPHPRLSSLLSTVTDLPSRLTTQPLNSPPVNGLERSLMSGGLLPFLPGGSPSMVLSWAGQAPHSLHLMTKVNHWTTRRVLRVF